MNNVLNWQLGRDMEYPYDAAYPDAQFAFVFNINRCIGCQSCTMACKSTWTFSKGQEYMWWNNVETKPYGGYPHHWDVKTLDLLEQANPGGQNWGGKPENVKAPYGKFNGKTIFEAANKMLQPASARVLGYLPTDEEWTSPNLYEDNPVGPKGVRNQFHQTGEQLPVHKENPRMGGDHPFTMTSGKTAHAPHGREPTSPRSPASIASLTGERLA